MLKLSVAEKAPVNEVVKLLLANIKKVSYLAITGMPEPDGSQKAVAVLIFPKGFHPLVGFHPWNYGPGSTMTNATVREDVMSVHGKRLTVAYSAGNKKIIVPPSAKITTLRKAKCRRSQIGAENLRLSGEKTSQRHSARAE